VGDRVIDLSPRALEELAIGLFDTSDKLVLIVTLVVLSGIFGAILGVFALRWWSLSIFGFAVFGVLGGLANAFNAQSTPGHAAVAPLISVGVGLVSLRMLTRLIAGFGNGGARGTAAPSQLSRRLFLGGTTVVAMLAAATGIGGRTLFERAQLLVVNRNDVLLPPARNVVAPVPTTAMAEVANISPVVTPNNVFYRIDTALSIPKVDVATWNLRVTGMVDREYMLTYEELLGLATDEEYVTLSCVSNEVGGSLVGNAKWQGVPLANVLTSAGVKDGAAQIVGRSVDGFTVGFPCDVAFDGRPALVAVGMNGEPLPFRHGFPARLVVSGLYGYVSATKWLKEIHLTTWEDFDGYWIPRGWSKMGPVKTQSRIDVPKPFPERVRPGPNPVAGVAWAQNRGISKVEVQVDNYDWEEARLATPISKHTWVQWVTEWDATPGAHFISVRATDSDGVLQPRDPRGPAPDGAEGWHRRNVRVTDR
jgi:DMSO/TMAO reductase YedYZ molybdopterin-dependent catalytic subunit